MNTGSAQVTLTEREATLLRDLIERERDGGGDYLRDYLDDDRMACDLSARLHTAALAAEGVV